MSSSADLFGGSNAAGLGRPGAAPMTGAQDPQTIPQLFFLRRAKASAADDALIHKRDGRWLPITWREYEGRSCAVARGIADWVQPRDIVCILSENRAGVVLSPTSPSLGLGCGRGAHLPHQPAQGHRLHPQRLRRTPALRLRASDQLAKVRELRAGGQGPQARAGDRLRRGAGRGGLGDAALGGAASATAACADPIEARGAEHPAR